MKNLYEEWIKAKTAEAFAQEIRREIEDKILETDPDTDGYKVVITTRMNRKINADLLKEIADENGLNDHLSDLFRWKPEINSKEWQSSDQNITSVFEEAITTTPGRASFKIEKLIEETK